MLEKIHLKKGLDIKLLGKAQKETKIAPPSEVYSILPGDFPYVVPKLEVNQGDKVKCGSPIFSSKKNPSIVFGSPVSGKILEIQRGEKRKILEIKILADKQIDFLEYGSKDPLKMTSEEIKEHLLRSACWPFIKARPYGLIADPEKNPKSIFISTFTSVPLAPDSTYVFEGKEKEILMGIRALQKLTNTRIHIGVKPQGSFDFLKKEKEIQVHEISGPHPSGNISTQIAHIDPIGKGEIIWTLELQDLIIIGELFITGKFNPQRCIAITGPQIKNPHYIQTRIGAPIKDLIQDNVISKEKNRYISGDVLTGIKVDLEASLRYYSSQITVLFEGEHYDLFGWILPRFNKFSISRAGMFSWMFPKKKYKLDTNLNGEERAFVFSDLYEKYFPLDIYPIELLKAILTKNIDRMEQLGIYEIVPEDFAITEFIDPSKQPHQEIIKKGIEMMIKEVG